MALEVSNFDLGDTTIYFLYVSEIPYHHRGGASRSIQTLFKELVRRGHSCLSISRIPGEKHVTIDGVKCLRTAVPEQWLENILKHEGPGQKVVLTQLAGDSWVVSLATKYGVPSILRIPSFSEYLCNNAFQFAHCERSCLSGTPCKFRVRKKVVQEASAVITSSSFAALAIKQFYDRDALVVYPPIDPESHLVEKSGDCVTLVNGDPAKGVHIFLRVAGKYKEFPYLIVKNAPKLDESWKDCRIESLPEQKDMRVVWRRTRILLVPSLVAESFGRVCVEAGLNGIPVVASDRGGLPESAGNEAVFPIDNIGGWQQEVCRLMTDLEYYTIRSAHARNQAQKFKVTTSVDKLESLASTLLSERSKTKLPKVTPKPVSQPVPKVVFFGPWIGEFGWEVATWQPWCRRQSKQYDKAYVCSFPGMEPLYKDFAEFVPHRHPKRELLWTKAEGVDFSKVEYTVPAGTTVHLFPIKEFRPPGDFIKFGDPKTQYSCLVHAARHIHPEKYVKDYPEELWRDVIHKLPGDVACIGTKDDLYVEGTTDLRGISLGELMDYMAGCKLVIGQSSGPMHLAAFCGTSMVVWGPAQAIGGSLKARYEEVWNPFKVRVEYILAPDWKPSPVEILSAVEKVLEKVT